MEKSINDEFERWLKVLGPTDPYVGQTTLGIRDVLRAHFLIADFFRQTDRGVGGIGPRDLGLLHSAMSRQHAGLGGIQKWNDKFAVCATLFYGLIKDHPFHDANKRTAFLSALYHLEKLGRCPTVDQSVFEELTVEIADNALDRHSRYGKFMLNGSDSSVLFIADFLRRNTREIDKKKYVINYRDLQAIIHKHGFSLENPSGNFIDIVRIEEKRSFPIFGAKQLRQTKLGMIRFPGWTKEVSQADIDVVRRKTELDYKHRVDSAAFFQDHDLMSSLIISYQEPLLRLAER